MEYATKVSVPQVQDLALAIKLYYAKNELSTADISKIFGCSNPHANKLKRRGREQMAEEECPSWNENMVNTECAFRAWGLNIEKMEKNLLRLRKLGLDTEKTA